MLLAVGAAPTLPAAAQSYLPKGWKLLEVVKADLNSDGRDDLVFVREEADPKKITQEPRSNDGVRNLNPRVMVVLLAEEGGYRKLAEYTKLIPPAFDPMYDMMDDRFNGISVKKGILTVGFRYWASAGTWWMSMESYKFRLEAGRLRLIGSETDSFHRGSGEKDLVSTNHLTGKVKRTSGLNEFDEKESKPKIKWETLPSRKPIYMDELSACARPD
ncbi:MAG: hypothetical protein RL444_893 [Verrucomicrobiota bacterium]|jgi:hypothetical protein